MISTLVGNKAGVSSNTRTYLDRRRSPHLSRAKFLQYLFAVTFNL